MESGRQHLGYVESHCISIEIGVTEQKRLTVGLLHRPCLCAFLLRGIPTVNYFRTSVGQFKLVITWQIRMLVNTLLSPSTRDRCGPKKRVAILLLMQKSPFRNFIYPVENTKIHTNSYFPNESIFPSFTTSCKITAAQNLSRSESIWLRRGDTKESLLCANNEPINAVILTWIAL